MIAPIIAVVLIGVLVVREMVSGLEGAGAKRTVRLMNWAMIPLLLVFFLTTVASRLTDLFTM